MSSSLGKIATPKEFLDLVVTKDLDELRADPGNIRKCWHCASSLFHQSDWVFNQHTQRVITDFNLPAGTVRESVFADALASMNNDFQLIRGIANSSKHHTLRQRLANPPYADYQPTSSANTVYQVIQSGTGSPVVHAALEGPNGQTLAVLPVAEKVYLMWQTLFGKYNW